MRAVARRLVLDDARADDVVQQTWLAALERPPAERGRLRAWLGRVARNFALRSLRDERRRGRRERTAARPEAVPAGVVDEVDAHRRVVEAVLSLAEPYRTTVLLRFYRDLPPRAIARATGVPGPTVRTRLRRALELLRARLDEEHGGDRDAWCLALFPLLWPRRAAAAGIGVKVGLVAAACALAGAVAVRREPAPRPPRAAGQQVAHANPQRAETAPREPAAAEAPADPVSAHEGWSAPGALEGLVLRGGRPAPVGLAHALRYRSWRDLPVPWHREEGVVHAHVDASGAFRFRGLEPGTYVVGLEIGGALVRETVLRAGPDRRTRRVLFVFGGGTLGGRVFDDLGRAVAGAHVHVSSAKESLNAHRQNTWADTGTDGAYSVDGLPAGSYWVGARIGDKPRADDHGLTRWIDLAAGSGGTLHLGRVRPLPTWSGIVRTRGGEPVHGPGRIQLGPAGAKGYSYVAFDEEGRFRATVLPDTYGLILHLPGVRFLEAGTLEVPETDFWRDIVVPGARVCGRASCCPPGRLHYVGLDGVDFESVPVAADGAFVIDGVPAGRHTLRCTPTGRGAEIDVGDEDDVIHVDIE